MIARIALLGAVACSRGPAPGAPGEVVVHPGEVVDRVVLSGALHPTHAVDLVVPPTDESSLVIRWMIGDGAVVKQGDRVIELDDSPFTDRRQDNRTRLTAAELQYRLARQADRKQLADKNFAIRQAEIQRDKARLQAELPADLVAARVAHGNQSRLVQTEDELRKTRSELATMVEQLGLEDKLKQIEVERYRRSSEATEQAIASLVIRAPRDGVVVIASRPSDGHVFRVGDTVQQDQVLGTQPDLGKPMEVRAELIDVDDGRIAADTPATCTLDAYPDQPIACSIVEVAPVARPKLGHDSLRRAFSVALELARSAPARMRPRMSVKVELRRPPRRGLVVPRAAVIRGDRDQVRLGSGELRGVTLGDCDAQRCVIASGLVDGDRVVPGATS